MIFTQREYKLLRWAEFKAKEMLGAHTGGPYEQAYRDRLKELKQLLLRIKKEPKRK